MNKLKAYTSVLTILMALTILVRCDTNYYSSLKSKGRLVVGLYSICNGTDESSQDISHMELYSRVWHLYKKVSFLSYDVCKNITQLSVVIENMLLDDTYYDTATMRYTIAAFVVDLKNELLDHLYKSVWHTGIPIFPLRDETDFTGSGNTVRSPSVYWFSGFNFEFMKRVAKWSTGRMLIVKDDEEVEYTEIIDKFFQHLRAEQKCYKTFKYDDFVKWIDDNNNKFTDSGEEVNDGVLLVIDTNDPTNYDNLIATPSFKEFSTKITTNISIKFKVQTKAKLNAMLEFFQNEKHHNLDAKTRAAFIDDSVYRADAFSTFEIMRDNFIKNKSLLNQDLQNYNPVTRKDDKGKYRDKNKGCRKSCPMGQQDTYHKHSSKLNEGEEAGFECVPCPYNMYKPDEGFNKCKECPKFQHVDECVLYRKFISKTSRSAYICMIMAVVLSAMCLAACSTLYKFRDTPIVTTSRLRTSIVHLTVIMTIFITVPVAYIGYPNKAVCIMRPLIVAVLYNCSVSLLLIKSNKILSAYNSKRVSSATNVHREIAAEIFLVILNQVIVLGLVVTMFFKNPANVEITTYTDKALTVAYCNTMDEHNIAVGYTIFLKVLCLVQAFRCRRLPSVLNEAMEIVYTCVIAIFFCVIQFIIQHSKRQDEVLKKKVYYICVLYRKSEKKKIPWHGVLFVVL